MRNACSARFRLQPFELEMVLVADLFSVSFRPMQAAENSQDGVRGHQVANYLVVRKKLGLS